MSHPLKPCRRCGGPKDRATTTRGSRYCAACQEVVDSADHRKDLERAHAKRRREAKLASGEHQGRRRTADAPEGHKWCAECQRFLPVTSFARHKDKLSAYCIPCSGTYSHEYMLFRQFGVTPERYAELLELQDGRCAICLARPRKRRLAVDHDHETEEIRGLLCTRCNHGILGKAHDSMAMLMRAVRYLQLPPATHGMPADPGHEQGDLEFIHEQLPFLRDGELAQHASREIVAITPRSLLVLAQAAGFALIVEGQRLEPPVQFAIDDAALLEQLHTASVEVM